MEIEICAVGGYNEVGKNMTAVKVGDEAVILDMGFYMQKIVDFEEEGGHRANLTSDELIKMGGIPDDRVIEDWKNKVKAIVVSHAHMDHYGACLYLGKKYKCPIIGTPYTLEVLKTMSRDDNVKLKNKLKSLNAGSKIKISKNITIEFINVTHSVPQTVIIAVHTPKGTVLYANDFKFDNHPVIGKKPDYERLKQLGKDNVIALIVDSLYSGNETKTPSEKVARELLKDVILGVNSENCAIIISCFASHLARLKSIIDFSRQLGRKVIFLGRSLAKYTEAAEKIKLVDFSKKVEIAGYRRLVKKRIENINPDEYVIVATGGQAEPHAVLSRMLGEDLKFKFEPEDIVIFSNKTIPVEPNLTNRARMEKRLRDMNVRIFVDVHTSGHASREDLRDLIKLVNPSIVIPAHGEAEKRKPMIELCNDMGYNSKLVSNGDKFVL